jgi:hypothetical protein
VSLPIKRATIAPTRLRTPAMNSFVLSKQSCYISNVINTLQAKPTNAKCYQLVNTRYSASIDSKDVTEYKHAGDTIVNS